MSGFPLESMKQNWRTWPNLFSSLRIALSWLPAYLLVTGSQDATLRWWALITFVLIAATDGIDGWLARKLNQTSEWGMFIDPIGDKLLVAFTFIALYAVNWEGPTGLFLAVTVWVMFAREFILAAQIRIVQGGPEPEPTPTPSATVTPAPSPTVTPSTPAPTPPPGSARPGGGGQGYCTTPPTP